MTLSELREALEKADKPCRKLDAELEAIGLARSGRLPTAEVIYAEPEGRVTVYGSEWKHIERAQKYTASLDAAVGLVERLLPGWAWSHDSETGETLVFKTSGGQVPVFGQYSEKLPALALCLALTRAMEAETSP